MIFHKRFLRFFYLSALLLIAAVNSSYSQSFCLTTYQDSTYKELMNFTSLTDTTIWDDTSFYVPIGFHFTFNGIVYDSVTVESNGALFLKDFNKLNVETIDVNGQPQIVVNDTLPVISPFGELFEGMNLIDRGYYTGSSKSLIHYVLSGTAPNREFAVEYKNVGFKSFDSLYAPDSLSFIVRLHESTNEITFHYGKGNATDSTFFLNSRGGVTGLGFLSTIDKRYLPDGYFLSGDPLNPDASQDLSFMRKLPAEGVMYSFTPSAITATVDISANEDPVCAVDTIIFIVTVTNGGPTPVYQWMVNNVVQGSDSAKFYGIKLSDGDSVRCYVTPAGLCTGGLAAVSDYVVVKMPVLSATISLDKDPSCPGDSITFSADVVNGGNASYNWRKNGLPIGSSLPTLKDKNFSDKDTVFCIVTSSLECASNTPDTTNKIIINKLPTVVPTLSLSSDKTSICNGDSVKFAAAEGNGGANPSYFWKVNGVVVNNNKASYTAKNLANASTVQCFMIPDLPCYKDTVASNIITITVNAVTTASVAVQPSASSVCAGTPVTFTATYSNGGNSPSFQWKINSTNVGTGGTSFVSSTLNDKDIVYCTMTSSKTCIANPLSSSNKVVMSVIAVPASSLSFPPDQKTQICPGDPLLLTVNATGAGSTPVYNWYVNDVSVNVNNTSYTAQNLKDGDKIYAVMQSSLNCKQGKPDTTEILTINVPAVTKAAITITADANPVCSSGTIHFSSAVQNEGSTPVYSWFLNGTSVGTDSPLLTLTGFNDKDKVYCLLTSDKACVIGNPAYSDTVTVGIIATPVSSISIDSDKDTVCSGEKIVFQATALNPGSNPVYQWKYNDLDVGFNDLSYTASNFHDGDSIWCILTTGVSCEGVVPVSNKIKVGVKSAPGAGLTITADHSEICKGGTLSFTASPVNPGTSPVYEWYVNGNLAGNNDQSFTSNTFNNGDQVKCEMSSGYGCNAVSNTLFVSVNPLLDNIDISPDKTVICNGDLVTFSSQVTATAQTYQWVVNGMLQSSTADHFSSNSFKNNDQVFCVADFGGGCIDTSDKVTITVKATCLDATMDALANAGIKIYPVPTKDNVTISFASSFEGIVSVRDNTGRAVKQVSKELGADEVTITLGDVPQGIYMIQIQNESRVWVVKLVKE